MTVDTFLFYSIVVCMGMILLRFGMFKTSWFNILIKFVVLTVVVLFIFFIAFEYGCSLNRNMKLDSEIYSADDSSGFVFSAGVEPNAFHPEGTSFIESIISKISNLKKFTFGKDTKKFEEKSADKISETKKKTIVEIDMNSLENPENIRKDIVKITEEIEYRKQTREFSDFSNEQLQLLLTLKQKKLNKINDFIEKASKETIID